MNHTKTVYFLRRLSIVLLALILLQHACHAGRRSPGKYSGVVIFDRWNACTLYGGIYLMYVAEKAKEGLRQYKGQAVEIDATEVEQHDSDGDGLIRSFKYLGPAHDSPSEGALSGLSLNASLERGPNGKGVIAVVLVENKGKESLEIYGDGLAPTLLVKKTQGLPRQYTPSDGPSFARVTRTTIHEGTGDWRTGKLEENGVGVSMTIKAGYRTPHILRLEPGEKRRFQMEFELSDGEYEFLCGYGGGLHQWRCIASNLCPFDIKAGAAIIPDAPTKI